ncbi:hypothetical protein CoNPh11_CDS0030 [Staphylococcus phage S-CoN_Ph11]|nr:hypothetical protein CoNPh11_CDS0030 [Staphylococcus phage S-CoN_Ph11]WNM54461.1 hypothetical protein CoNPh17_CDS0266 [Staphylococcus phage S-CoN_Ph17]
MTNDFLYGIILYRKFFRRLFYMETLIVFIMLAFIIFSEIMVYVSNNKIEAIIFSTLGILSSLIGMAFLFNI